MESSGIKKLQEAFVPIYSIYVRNSPGLNKAGLVYVRQWIRPNFIRNLKAESEIRAKSIERLPESTYIIQSLLRGCSAWVWARPGRSMCSQVSLPSIRELCPHYVQVLGHVYHLPGVGVLQSRLNEDVQQKS